MPQPTSTEAVYLVAGKVSASHYDRLVEKHTDIRSKTAINAMREHLVNGVSQAEACRMHGARPSTVCISLKILQKASGEILELMKEPFYQQAVAGELTEQVSA
ncbi:PapB/FocB family fimbrial expression transcriptional regulator (plasmid) [Pseudomonas silesiensis]|uniref:PapB/FocB family fimbrial expression transcriptional regulator n=1 Tax=Pseudomonas silesiensis TaxID=1853130 RepID=UPI0030CDD633